MNHVMGLRIHQLPGCHLNDMYASEAKIVNVFDKYLFYGTRSCINQSSLILLVDSKEGTSSGVPPKRLCISALSRIPGVVVDMSA
jgi:hypothetical protein